MRAGPRTLGPGPRDQRALRITSGEGIEDAVLVYAPDILNRGLELCRGDQTRYGLPGADTTVHIMILHGELLRRVSRQTTTATLSKIGDRRGRGTQVGRVHFVDDALLSVRRALGKTEHAAHGGERVDVFE